jgi:hypothetical protein
MRVMTAVMALRTAAGGNSFNHPSPSADKTGFANRSRIIIHALRSAVESVNSATENDELS